MRGFDFDKALVALQNELHCFAYKLTADKDEAEDLLQETMLRTLDNKDKFDSGTNFKAGCIPSCAMHLSIIAGQRKYEGIYMYYQNLNIISC